MNPFKASKKDLKSIKPLSAIENKDCHWDFDAHRDLDPPRYVNIKRLQDSQLAGIMNVELRSANSFSDEVEAAVDEGHLFGTTSVEKNCPVIEKFTKGIPERSS